MKGGATPAPVGDLEAAIGDFLAAQRAQGASPGTMRYYQNVLLKILLPWCQQHELAELQQLSQRTVDEFAGHLLGRQPPLAKSSAASYLRAVRSFLRWAESEDLVGGLKVRSIKVPRPVLDTLSRAEIARLEVTADTERDRLIVRVLADCGLRLSELLALTADDVVEQRPRWFLRVQARSHGGGAKGDRGRLVPVKPELARRLRRLATQGRPSEVFSSRIFISLRRRPPSGQYEPLDPRAVQQMLKDLAERAGIRKRVHPHLLRHSYVTNSLRAGVNPLLVAQSAGHRDLTMIQQVYSHLDASDAYDEMMRTLREEE